MREWWDEADDLGWMGWAVALLRRLAVVGLVMYFVH